MKSRLFTLLLALLPLLFSALWLRSYFWLDEIGYHRWSQGSGREWWCIRSASGLIAMEHAAISILMSTPQSPPGFYTFHLKLESSWPSGSELHFVPDWLVLCLLSLPCLLLSLYSQWRWRHVTGLCPTCSYNLTGNTSGTCPECGTPIPNTSMLEQKL